MLYPICCGIIPGLLVLALIPTPALAQTMAVSVDPDRTPGGAPLVQVFDVTISVAFDVVVWLDSAGHPGQAVEFVVTDLAEIVPGVFKISTVTIGNPIDLGLEFPAPGEFALVYGECVAANNQLELARITYADFTGVLGMDQVMTVRGFQPGDSVPSTFGGQPGFVDCDDALVSCEMGGTAGGVTGSGVTFPAGALILNATPLVVPTGDGSIARLKAKFY